jgi:hypothetical protein
VRVANRAGLPFNEFEIIESELRNHQSLQDLSRWAQTQPEGVLVPGVISRLIVQDEFSHDLVIPWRNNLYLAYGTT